MSKNVKRLYNGADLKMLTRADAIHSMFLEFIDTFTAFDSRLDASYAAMFQTKIEAARRADTNIDTKYSLKILTEEVLQAMEQCRIKYRQIRYFSQEAFVGKEAVIKEFGKKDYPLCRDKQYKLTGFMDELHKTCLKHEAALIAKGLTALEIAEIETLGNLLKAANTEQENYKRNRMVLTEELITAHNDCYKTLMTIMRAAKVIYMDDYAHYNLFVFKRGSKRKKGGEEEE